MADKKYVARAVALNVEQLALIDRVRTSLKERLGFAPSLSESIAAAATQWFKMEEAPRFVYVVWCNDHLRGIFREGSRAEALLLDWKRKIPEGTWTKLPSDDPTDPYVQRWHQTDGPIARLAVEKEMVQ